jgi:hypothetical protein
MYSVSSKNNLTCVLVKKTGASGTGLCPKKICPDFLLS